MLLMLRDLKMKYFQRISCCWSHACNFIKKEILAQVFSCGFCEISKNTFFYRIPPVAASEYIKLTPNQQENTGTA